MKATSKLKLKWRRQERQRRAAVGPPPARQRADTRSRPNPAQGAPEPVALCHNKGPAARLRGKSLSYLLHIIYNLIIITMTYAHVEDRVTPDECYAT